MNPFKSGFITIITACLLCIISACNSNKSQVTTIVNDAQNTDVITRAKLESIALSGIVELTVDMTSKLESIDSTWANPFNQLRYKIASSSRSEQQLNIDTLDILVNKMNCSAVSVYYDKLKENYTSEIANECFHLIDVFKIPKDEVKPLIREYYPLDSMLIIANLYDSVATNILVEWIHIQINNDVVRRNYEN